MFSDSKEAPAMRMMSALTVYNEMEMRCDREYLEKHCKAFDKILDSNKVVIRHLVQLNNNLKERLSLMPMPDYIYKLASVVFFDESESPYTYDYEYAEKKIERWKKDGATLDFFLKSPLATLIPSLKLDGASISIFSSMIKKGGRNTPSASYRYIVRKSVESRSEQMMWVAGDDPIKLQVLQRMPLLEYWQLLDNKIALTMEMNKRGSRKHNH